MKKILLLVLSALLIMSGIGCNFATKETSSESPTTGSTEQIQKELGKYNGTYTGNVYISGYGSQPAAITIINGSFSISLTSVYFYLEKKETSSARSQYESQMKALNSQYKLGLITRTEYEQSAANYQNQLDDIIAPIAAKYSNSLFSSHVQKDEEGYFAIVKGEKARMTFGVTGITYKDPVSGLTISF